MSLPLFAFELQEFDQIQPWGTPENPNLHWFGLSEGAYWMNAGQTRLFEYSKTAQEQGSPRYCEYPVVRLYEDILAVAPYVLEEVPAELRHFIEVDADEPWDRYWHTWRDLPDHLLTTEDGTDLLEAGAFWLSHRTLDSLYLSSPANIRMWSDAEHVHVQWDNRERIHEGMPVWAASIGTYAMTRGSFLEEILAFHSQFMAQMAARVGRVVAGGLPSRIRIDLNSLMLEQQQRALPIGQYLSSPEIPTDWSLVSSAVKRLEELRHET